MMVAMMFPTAAPMILTFHRIQAGKRERGDTFVATWIFIAAYMVIWTLAGVAAYLAALGAEALATWASLSPTDTARIDEHTPNFALLRARGNWSSAPAGGSRTPDPTY
jgi:predicted metal-binding membrane protein